MLRVCLGILLLTVCMWAVVRAGEEVLVLRVEKPVSCELADLLGPVCLVDMGDAYLALGDANSEARLARAGVGFSRILKTEPGREIFLLREGKAWEAPWRAAALVKAAPGTYLAAVRPSDVLDVYRLPYARVRLAPGPFPQSAGGTSSPAGVPVVADRLIEEMVSRVSGDTLWRYISELSGAQAVDTYLGPDTLRTRYSLSEDFGRVTDYVAARLGRSCPDVYLDPYVIGTTAFYAVSFPNDLDGWVVGNEPAVYRTRDGGASWEYEPIDAPHTSFWGVAAIGDARAWICGTGGTVYATSDGGDTWHRQPGPARVTLNGVCFLDSLNGWVVGDGGFIMRTTDGGVTWEQVESGTTSALYGLDFRSADRGWVCGEDGCVLFWNGGLWSSLESSSTEDLMDIAFGDDLSGWAVGHGSTVLRTDDGGATWFRQEIPGGLTPFLEGVFAWSRSEAWIVGLNGTILATDDGGVTWGSPAPTTLFGLRRVCFVDDLEGWAAGYGSTVLHTSDGGWTWESQKEQLPSQALIRLSNVVGIKHGTGSDREVIICGHYDSISEDPYNRAPGADDNATGAAAVLESARVLHDCNFERTIRFILFSGEEQGVFGSGEYAADARRAGAAITGVLNFDMIGYVDAEPEDIDLVGNEASEWLVDEAAECAGIYAPGLAVKRIIDPAMILSDHGSFWKAGYYAILGIEDRDLHYPFYHTTGDTLGNLNQAFTTDVVRMAVGTVAHLARPDTSTSGPNPPTGLRIVTALPNPFRSEIEITFVPGESGDVEASVVDVRGRRVKTIAGTWVLGKGYVARWDGLDEGMEPAAPGIYFAVVGQAGHHVAAKVVLLR
jgi:photosystem II stability/assembly factor-like uncharacterized protein